MQLIIPNTVFGSSGCDDIITWTDHKNDIIVCLHRKYCVELNCRCRGSTLCSGPVCRRADRPHWPSLPPTAVSHWPTPNAPQSGVQLGGGAATHAWTGSRRSAATARWPAGDILGVRCGHLGALWIIPLCFSECIHLCNEVSNLNFLILTSNNSGEGARCRNRPSRSGRVADWWSEGAEERHMGSWWRLWLCPGNRPPNSNGTDRFAKDPVAHVQTHATYSSVAVVNPDSVPHPLKQEASHRCSLGPTHWDVPAQPLPLVSDVTLQHPPIPGLRFGAAVRSQRCQQDHRDEMQQLSSDHKWNRCCARCLYPRTRAVAIMKCCPDNCSSRKINSHFNWFWSLYFKKMKSHLLVVIAQCISCFWSSQWWARAFIWAWAHICTWLSKR